MASNQTPKRILPEVELNLITNRTQADVDRALYLSSKGYEKMTEAEKSEWDSGLKGVYNASDLNRVESAVAYIAEALVELQNYLKSYAKENNVYWGEFFRLPYDAEAYVVETKTDWAKQDVPSSEDMSRYLANVVLLCGALEYPTGPLPGTMRNLTYTGANAVERALNGLNAKILEVGTIKKQYIELAASAQIYSGEIYGGET